ncbi:VWA domain-containing protein [Akkermansiaceae bacterium]|nr:VWA domain-containing protein [Akkermansiaceae bacterium]
MKTLHNTCLALAIAAAPLFAANDESASPYFQIHGDHRADVFPLKETHAEVTVAGTIAEVTLTQTYTNDGETPIDATYLFPASTGAAVNGMTMTIGERVLTAKIREKEQAKREFEKAKAENKSASLLSQQRPNLFQMEVARIMPGDVVKLSLRYSELIKPVGGTYEFVLPTAIGPRFTGEGKTEGFTANPHLGDHGKTPSRFSVDLKIATPLPLRSLTCTQHEAKITYLDKSSASLELAPTAPDRDFIVRYRLADEKIASGLMLHQGDGEKFFLLQVEPPAIVGERDIPARDYVFLIDVSGSMHGFPINLAKSLFRELIGNLRPTDTFNVVLFSGGSEVLSSTPLAANPANIEKATGLLSRHSGSGGTQLIEGLQTAIALPTGKDISRSLILITDGYISAEPEAFELIRSGANGTNVFPLGVGSSVNRHLIEGLAHIAGNESFVVTNSSETQDAVKRFRDAVSSPVLTGITVKSEGFQSSDLQPAQLPDLFANRPLTLIGKWNGEPEGTIALSGITGDGRSYTQRFEVSEAAANPENPALRTLWARETVRSLADYAELTGKQSIIDEVTEIGLEYELLTPYTSFVAIDERPREDTSPAVPVAQALPLPKGVCSGAGGSVPEPNTFLMIALVLVATALLRIR